MLNLKNKQGDQEEPFFSENSIFNYWASFLNDNQTYYEL